MKNFSDYIFWLKMKILNPYTILKYRELINNQKLSINEVEQINWEKRKSIVKHAYENTKFYKNYYDSCNFHPSELVSESDWDKVPILERSMIRENFNRITMDYISRKRLEVATTGGSTGQPLKVYHDKRFPRKPLVWRYLSWWNVNASNNHGTIHRRVPTSRKQKMINSLTWFPTKLAFLNATSFSENDILIFLEQIKKKRIVRITGYVGAIEKIAEYVIKNNITILGIKHIWTTSAPLSLTARSKIEKAFSCKVMDQYGSCEIPSLAQQCPWCDGLHINSDVNHIDIVDENNNIINDYRIGDVIVTNMESFAFPLIRYRLGDKSNFLDSSRKKCNLPFPLLNFVSGRISDTIITPSGLSLNGDYLTTIFDDYVDNIFAFQVYQKKDASLIIKVVVNKKMINNDEVLEIVRKTVEQKVNFEIQVSIEMVENIPDDRGKTRYVISELNEA